MNALSDSAKLADLESDCEWNALSDSFMLADLECDMLWLPL